MTDLFDDIRSDLIKTKYRKIWEKYGKYSLLIIISIIAITLFVILRYDLKNKNELIATTNLFNINKNFESFNEEKLSDMQDLFNHNASLYHYGLVKLKLAEYYLTQQKISAAYEVFYEIYIDENIDQVGRDFSELMLNYLIYYYPANNKEDDFIINNISTDNIFYYQILEVRALALIEQKKYKESEIELNKIIVSSEADPNTINFSTNLLRLLKDSEL